jgi:hypothetical protein
MKTANENLAISNLWYDANQGLDADDRAFGYIGTNEETVDTDGDDCEYCGWFFTWPGKRAIVTTAAEVEAVVASLETDETARHLPIIPQELVEAKLREKLAANLAKNEATE